MGLGCYGHKRGTGHGGAPTSSPPPCSPGCPQLHLCPVLSSPPCLTSSGLPRSPHITHRPQMHPHPKYPSRNIFFHEVFSSHEQACPTGPLCTPDSPCLGAWVLSMAALRLWAPPSRRVPAAVGMMSCCPQHRPLLISEVLWLPLCLSLFSHRIQPLSRTNRDVHTSLCSFPRC